MPALWLQTLFEKWRSARGDRLAPAERPFSAAWPDLLDEAGLRRVEDRRAAELDLNKLHEQKLLKAISHPYRPYLIERVHILVEAEAWLQKTFGHRPASERQAASLDAVSAWAAREHPRFPELWRQWCQAIHQAFRQGGNLQPLMWKAPEETDRLMRLAYDFSAVSWPEKTHVRDASARLGLGSKGLEPQKSRLESCLISLLGRRTTLESCGLVLSEPKAEMAGRLTLHFSDGTAQPVEAIRGIYSLPLLPDLERAVRISTPAARVITVENAKTCLPQLADLNREGGSLLMACTFPNRAVLRVLSLLPPELPVWHFGDADPAGFLILAKLREQAGRAVRPYLMVPRPAPAPVPLTEYDRKLLPGLLGNPWLEDVRGELASMQASQDKGLFEQESWGAPDLKDWPFHSAFL